MTVSDKGISSRPRQARGRLPVVAGLLLICFASIFMYERFTPPAPENTVIRLHDDQIDIQKLNNEIALFIIEKGYGYKVEKVENTIKEVHSSIIDGDIDISLEIWRENNIVWYEKAIMSGNVMNLGVLYDSGRQFWIIPQWFAKENKIENIFDMKKYWRQFPDPEDPSKGLFFNCIFGWNCRDINKVKLKAYGLDKYFNTVSPSSPEALRAIYQNALDMHIPVFGYYWQPNAIMASDGWYILKEPPYSSDVWYRVNQAAMVSPHEVVDQACAYGDNSVIKIAHENLQKKAPDVVEMLKKMSVDIEILEGILFQSNGEKTDFMASARYFLLNYGPSWYPWVTESARNNILEALEIPLSVDNDNF